MTNMIEGSARFLLFGAKLDSRIDLQNVLMHKGSNFVRSFMGMPPNRGPGFTDLLMAWGKRIAAELLGISDQKRLPDGMPVKLYQTIDATVRNRGGTDPMGNPFYWANAKQTTSNPFFWSIVIDYQPTADPGKIANFELAIEDQLSRAGYDYNVRILSKPMRVEIDKPDPFVVTLRELWDDAKELPINERKAICGLKYRRGAISTAVYSAVGEDFSGFIVGSPGSGKTQLASDIVLTLALSNAPSVLTFVIIDPKAIDFRPYNVLPHLALPVVTEPTRAVEVIQALVDEMDRRTACAARGDNSFLAHNIFLYVDELADLLNSLPTAQSDQVAKNFQRLTQKGRGYGYLIIGATQRVHEVPAPVHSKLNCRFVGRTRNANDSSAASGVAGTTTHKLPGKGSFECYADDTNGGMRIQAAMVAASDKKGYEAALAPFFADIIERWQGDPGPGWRLPDWSPETPTPEGEPAQWRYADVDEAERALGGERAFINTTKQAAPVDIDPELLTELQLEYQEDPEGFNGSTVRRMYTILTGKQMDGNKAKRIRDQFLDLVAKENAAKTG